MFFSSSSAFGNERDRTDRGGLEPARSAGESDAPRTGEFYDPVLRQQILERVHLLRRARHLHHQCGRIDVHHLRSKDLDNLDHLRAAVRLDANLDKRKLALDGGIWGQLRDAQDVDQLVQLLRHLLERLVLDADGDGHPGDGRVLGLPNCERIDVESAAGEQTRDASKHAWLVLHQHRDRVAAHAPTASSPARPPATRAPSSRGVVTPSDDGTGPTMMPSFEAPAGIIGKHISAGSTLKSMTLGRSSTASALSITASISSVDSARSPMAPYASASFT